MSNLPMCDGDGCRKRETCYRFTAKPDSLQTYIKTDPKTDPKTCQHYWPECSRCGSGHLTEKMGGMVCDKCRIFHAYQKS